MRIHILGICGTFMAGLAQILKESGHDVSGTDIQFYPPMSEYIEKIGIKIQKSNIYDNESDKFKLEQNERIILENLAEKISDIIITSIINLNDN